MSLGYEAVLQADTQLSIFFIFLSFFFKIFLRYLAHKGFITYAQSNKHTQYSTYIEIYIYMARKYIYLYINMVYVVKCIVYAIS